MHNNIWVSMPIIRNIVLGSGCSKQQVEMICNAGDIKPGDLDNAENRLTLEQNCGIMEAALFLSGKKNLGLEIGRKTSSVVLGITGHLMQTSKDAITALENLQQFTSSFTRLYSFYIEILKDDLLYYCEPLQVWNDISPETARHSVDMAYAGTLHVLFLLTGKHIYPKEVKYRYARVSDTSLHEEIFKCRPSYNGSGNYLLFSLNDVKTPVITYNQQLNDIFKNLLEQALQKEFADNVFTLKVRQTILQNFRSTFPQVDEVAEQLHITTRTLQRKLKEENTSFRHVSDSIKQDLARSLLNNNNLTIAQIAYKLGYKDPSNFQRAFRLWTGTSPNAFRFTKA